MKEVIKKQYKNILLVLSYIIIGVIVYVTLSYNLWEKWYLSLIIALLVIIFGAIIGFIYIKSIIEKEKE